MPKRKSFENLSCRQKRRRINEKVIQDMKEIKNELQKSTTRSGNDILVNELLVDETVDKDLLEVEVELSNSAHPLTNENLGDTIDYDSGETGIKENQLNVPSSSMSLHQSENHKELENFAQVDSNEDISASSQVKSAVELEPVNEYGVFLQELEIEEDDLEFFDASDEEYFSDESANNDLDFASSDSLSDDDNLATEKTNFQSKLLDWYGKTFVSRQHMNDLLGILREEGHPELPKDWRTIAKTPQKTNIIPCDPGEYFHYGLEQSLKDILARENIKEKTLLIDINIDGLPLTKSTNRTLWPIQGRLVGYVGISPFVVGVYHGKQKPSSVQNFLNTFITEYETLNMNGFLYEKDRYFVAIKCVICDAPAACFVTCTKYYNGRFGCRRCMVEGDWMGRMVFLNYARLRTDENFRNREDEDHHSQIISPFERLKIDMVFQFPLDYMHLVCLGVMKLLIKIWLKFKPRFSASQLEALSVDFVNLGKYVPKEFNRKPQSLLELHHWKATTARFFLLYGGLVILNGHISNELVLHFNYFSIAIRILCDPKNYLKNNSYAEELLVKFVKKFMTLYHKQYVTFNLHSLGHLAGDAKIHGHLDSFSAFDFENYMMFLKKLIRKNERPLQQIHRRLVEQRHPSNKRKNILKHHPILMSKKRINLPFGCTDCHGRLKFEQFELCDSSPDNCCIMKDKSIVCIDYIGKQADKIVVIGKKFLEKISVPNFPEDSLKFGICQVKEMSNVEVFLADDIIKKVCLFLHKDVYYAIPMIHS